MRVAVFCTAEIPAPIVKTFLECLDVMVQKNKECVRTPMQTTMDYVVFMTTLNIEAIASSDVALAPTDVFASPFVGWDIEQLRNWFRSNVGAARGGFTPFTFIVLDQQSIQDETCLLVDVHDEHAINSIRTDFYVPVGEAIAMEFGGEWIKDGLLGSFMRSGVVATKENLELAQNGGVYVEGGEVRVDLSWRDFRNW